MPQNDRENDPEIKRRLEALGRIVQHGAEMLKRHGGYAGVTSVELLEEARAEQDERNFGLMFGDRQGEK